MAPSWYQSWNSSLGSLGSYLEFLICSAGQLVGITIGQQAPTDVNDSCQHLKPSRFLLTSRHFSTPIC